MGGGGKINLATGAGFILVSSVAAAAWAVAWRRRTRTGTVLADRFRPAGPASVPPPGRPQRQLGAPRPSRPARSRQGAGLLLGSDELLRLADCEDARW